MKILVLDSGVDVSHPLIKNIKNIVAGIAKKSLVSGEISIDWNAEVEDEIGHGTAITYLLAKNRPNDTIFSVKVWKKKDVIDENWIIEILQYICENDYYDVINFSAAIVRCKKHKKLEEICIKLRKKEMILISAFENNGRMSYPALFESVLGVDITPNSNSPKLYFWIKNSAVNIRAGMSRQRLPWKNHKMQYVGGTSFCVPYISCKVAEAIEYNGHNISRIYESLEENAIKCIDMGEQKDRDRMKIKRVIVFPYTKEMYNIVQFASELLIYGVYDIKGRRNIGRRLTSIKGDSYIIKNWEEINWESDFDTIIVGHIRIIERIYQRELGEELICMANKFKKQVYMFDPLTKSEEEKAGDNIRTPYMQKFPINNYNFGKLYRTNIPVVGIVGTSSKQGKFNLQLQLRNKFIENGFSVGQLGTEPSAELLGFDEVFPYGYNTEFKYTPIEVIQYVNYLMHKIDENNKDLIIFGCQSNLIHLSTGNARFYPSYQYEILSGADPDAVIVCVNYDDDMLYIEKTLRYIETMTYAKTIGLVVYPFKKFFSFNEFEEPSECYNENQIVKRKKEVEEKFGIPTACLTSEKDIDFLYRKVVEYFTEK